MAKLVKKGGADGIREFPLAEGLNRIGRAPGNEILLDDPTVSTEHCELWLMKERLLLRDLDSTNGTYIDGKAISEIELHSGDVVAVGSVELTVADVAGHVAIPPAPEPPPPPPRFTPEGEPCCLNHSTVPADYRCPKCGEQFCSDCVRILRRRGSTPHAYCPQCSVDCIAILSARGTGAAKARSAARVGWLAKLTQTLKIRR